MEVATRDPGRLGRARDVSAVFLEDSLEVALLEGLDDLLARLRQGQVPGEHTLDQIR